MNIVYFYQYFGTTKGGWSSRVYELTKRWVLAGHQVTVVTSPYYKSDITSNGFISKQNIEGINLVVINLADSNKSGTLKRGLNAILFSIISIFYALKLPADIIISSSGPITITLPALFAKWLRKKPIVFEVRDLWPRGAIELGKIKNPLLIRISLWFEKICYKNASLVIPCSPGMNDAIKQVNPNVNTLVIPNASDLELFNIPVTPPKIIPFDISEKSVFIYAGSLGLMDDCSQIIKAMAYIEDKNIVLAIAGDGAEKTELIRLSEETANPNIYFIGLIPKTEVVKWFSISTASFVTFKDYPVLHTSSPNKMFDSFAAGLPIIQSTKGWIKTLVDNEGCGINVNPDSPKDFASAMLTLTTDRVLQQKMSLRATYLASTIFNRDNLSQEYLSSLISISGTN